MTNNQDNFKLDFIGIGAQRSGTTWIATCLDQHPQICLSSPKEIHFFGTPKFDFGLTWYKKHFSPKSSQIVGEFDAGYLSSETASVQIKEYFPEIKIIVSLRDPVQRAFSNYLSIASFEAQNQSFEDWLNAHPEMINRGLYYSHLKKYFDLFERENILVLIYEDIEKNPSAFVKKIYDFLGVDPNFTCAITDNRSNTSKVYRLPLLKRIVGKTITYVRSLRYGVNIANFLRKIGFRRILRFIEKSNSKAVDQDMKISAETKNKLRELYRSEIEQLEKLINRDLSLWG